MAKFGGVALKSVSVFLRAIEFCCAAIILGFFCYFLATLKDHSLYIPTYIRAVTGISGAAVIYTIVGLLLVCCLGGIAILSIIAMLLDLAFTGAFIYIAWATRGGADSCRGNVSTPFGNGNTDFANEVTAGDGGITILPSFRTSCRMQTACFAVAIIACIFFPISLLLELALIKHHRKEKAFGPSPNNGYTAGSPRRKFWQRKPKHNKGFVGEKNTDTLPTHTTPADMRTSYAGTDTTAVGEQPQVYNKYATPVQPATGHNF
jgi:hypothetical protein